MVTVTIWCQVCVKKKKTCQQIQAQSHRSITFTFKRKFFFHGCFVFSVYPLPCSPPPSSSSSPHLPWTVLGWRLKSPEWAHSNFYPSFLSASHDPWAYGIAPSLFIPLYLTVLIFKWLLSFIVFTVNVYQHCYWDSSHLQYLKPCCFCFWKVTLLFWHSSTFHGISCTALLSFTSCCDTSLYFYFYSAGTWK